MQKSLLKRYVTALAGLLVALACLITFEAGLYANAQTSGGFSIRAIIPDNQLDKRQTYFDLRMEPGDEQTVQVVITNSRQEELVAQVGLNAASTARDGLITYTKPSVRDDIMNIAITDVATLREEVVTVPPNDSKAVDIQIKMPEEPFDGVILGGITVTSSDVEDETESPAGVSIKNNITYVIALKLTENNVEVTPDFDLTSVTPTLVNHRTAVAVSLRNRAARIAKGMEINAQVSRKGSDSVLHGLTLNEAEMAPLSKGEFVIDWEGEAFRPGTYRMKMSALYEGRLWEWDEEFTIAGEAGELNRKAVGIKKDYTLLYLLFGLAILALIWVIAYRAGKRRKNEN